MDYPFSSIHLNGREILLRDIIDGKEKGKNDFESDTLTFLQRWLHGENTFHLQTSGSTGSPKRIELSREQMASSALATQQALGLKRLDKALVCLDTRYIAGQMMLVRCLVTGMSITAITPSANPLENYRGKKIDFVAMVPYQVKAILKSETSSSVLDSIDTLIIGGASLSKDIIDGLQRFQCKAYATFGMTETISHIALRRINGVKQCENYETLPGIEIHVDSRSCLIIRCPYLSQQIVTNDIVEIHNPNTFRWIGRADNVINTGGVKVSPETLEERLHPLIRSLNLHDRFIVSSTDDIALGNKVVLVLELQNLDSETKTVIISRLQNGLQKFEVPRSILTVYPFPETASGKIDRLTIKKMISKQQ